MQYYNTTFTPNSLGVWGIGCGFAPKAVKVTLSAKGSPSDNVLHNSVGSVDASGYTTLHSLYSDTTGARTYRQSGTGKIASQYERVSGSITEVNAAFFDSFYATGVDIDVTKVNAQYQYNVEFWG